MLRNLSWHTTDTLARNQFHIYRELGNAMGISEDEGRRVLLLNPQEWNDWADFLNEGPLPAQPPLPEMLQRLGHASHHLAVLAERQAAPARA
jgi:N-acyl-D-aspartate/D-glutamate deacylase